MVDIGFNSKSSGKAEPLTTLQYMKQTRRWLLWRSVPSGAPGVKPKKIPYYANSSLREKTDTPEDYAQLTDFETASQKLREYKGTPRAYTGLGFALGPDGSGLNWQGCDVDRSLEGAQEAPGYVEISQSGNGFHSIGFGRAFSAHVDNASGTEFYSAGRYFAFTGDQVRDGPLFDLFEMAGGRPPPEEGNGVARVPEALSEQQTRDLKAALSHLDPSPYEVWAKVALALRGVEDGEAVFLEWARRSPKFDEAENRKKFATVGEPICHWKAVLSWAKESGWDPRTPSFPALEQEAVDTSQAPFVEYVLKDFIPAGTLVVGGMYGVGKTSQLLSLALRACGCAKGKDQWAPDLRRQVVYFTESLVQMKRMLYGARQLGLIGVSDAELGKWLRFFPVSGRMPVKFWEEQLRRLREEAAVDQEVGDGGPPLRVYPLLIIDTVPNLVVIEQENDNSEVSQLVASLRSAAGPSPCWLVTHLAKALKDADPDSYTARGAGAWGAGTDGEIFVYANADDPDDGHRYIRLGKDRVGVEHRQVRVSTEVFQGSSTFRTFTEKFTVYLGGDVEPYPESERRAAKDQAREARKEGNDQGRLMGAVGRFKKMLAGSPGRGLAVCHVRGGQPAGPEGYEVIRWDDVVAGLGGKGAFRAQLVDAVLEAFKPANDGRFYIFLKPDFAVA